MIRIDGRCWIVAKVSGLCFMILRCGLWSAAKLFWVFCGLQRLLLILYNFQLEANVWQQTGKFFFLFCKGQENNRINTSQFKIESYWYESILYGAWEIQPEKLSYTIMTIIRRDNSGQLVYSYFWNTDRIIRILGYFQTIFSCKWPLAFLLCIHK